MAFAQRLRDCTATPVGILVTLMALGVVVAAVSGAMVSWDGGYYLFRVLDLQTFFQANRREINIPLELPLLAASRPTATFSSRWHGARPPSRSPTRDGR